MYYRARRILFDKEYVLTNTCSDVQMHFVLHKQYHNGQTDIYCTSELVLDLNA